MPSLTAYLAFDGTCAEAMRFYERTLNGKIETMLKTSETPVADHVPPGNADRIMHAHLLFDGGELMAGDSLVGDTYKGMSGFSLALTYPTAAAARRVFDALGEGGRVTMPFDSSFWADGFGMVIDRFGTPWIINGGMKEF